LNDYIIHFDVINQSLESVKSILKTDLVTPKDGINQSKRRGNQHEESTSIINLKNKQEEAAGRINNKNTSSIPGRVKYPDEIIDSYFGSEVD